MVKASAIAANHLGCDSQSLVYDSGSFRTAASNKTKNVKVTATYT